MIESSAIWSSIFRRLGCRSKVGTAVYTSGLPLGEEDASLLQGRIPVMLIDGQDCGAGPFSPPSALVGCKAFVKHKALASLLMSVRARAVKVFTDTKKRADTPEAGSGYKAKAKSGVK